MAEESPIPWQCFERMWVIILAFYRPSSGKPITSDDPPNGRGVVEFNKGTQADRTSISHLFMAGILSAPELRYNFSFPWPVKGQTLARLYCGRPSVRQISLCCLCAEAEGPEVANSQERERGAGTRWLSSLSSTPPSSPLTCPLSVLGTLPEKPPGALVRCLLLPRPSCPRRCLGLSCPGRRSPRVPGQCPLLLSKAARLDHQHHRPDI